MREVESQREMGSSRSERDAGAEEKATYATIVQSEVRTLLELRSVGRTRLAKHSRKGCKHTHGNDKFDTVSNIVQPQSGSS